MEAAKLRPGNVFRMDGHNCLVLEAEYVQNDRRRFIRVKIKNLESGVMQEHRFNDKDYFEDVFLEKREYQLLYNVDNLYTFMDIKTFEQIDIDHSLVADALQYNTDGIIYTFEMIDEKIVKITPPTFVILKVVETQPAVAGNTAGKTQKNAVLETGISIRVPMFVNIDDKIKVDTRTAEYVERA